MNIKGILPIIKPLHWTSHRAVNTIKRKFNIKAGHAGTLDPAATGVLVICLGEATKAASYLQQTEKTYIADILLGTTTDTDDMDGKIIKKNEEVNVKQKDIKKILPEFIGTIDQVPPVYSAIHVDGRRLYDYARRGIEKKVLPRKVVIKDISLESFKDLILTLKVRCRSGTYIRALARDIGKRLGCGASLAGLVRTRSGIFSLKDAYNAEDIIDNWSSDDLPDKITPIERIFKDTYEVKLSSEEYNKCRNGNFKFKDWTGLKKKLKIGGLIKLTYNDKIITLAKYNESSLKIIKVFLYEDL
ncbi:MAG: tRNA pseudouridine(55) synthase TruB [Elusimicrobiota bacterium]